MSSNQKPCIKQKLRCILYSSLGANCVLLIVLCALIAIKEVNKKQIILTNRKGALDSRTSLPGDSGVCIPCDYLGKDVTAKDTLFDRIERSKEGHRVCCTNRPSYLPKLIGKMLMSEKERETDNDDYDDLKRQLDWWRNRPGSIHMNLDLQKLKDNKFVWKLDNDPLGIAFRNGVQVNNVSNGIVIPRKAVYFVYVAITFDFGDLSTVPIFYHNVTKSHPLLPNTIDTLLMTKYGGSTESENVYTSFLCGAFEMQGDYYIKTEVSSYEYVSRSKYASYFGMFRI